MCNPACRRCGCPRSSPSCGVPSEPRPQRAFVSCTSASRSIISTCSSKPTIQIASGADFKGSRFASPAPSTAQWAGVANCGGTGSMRACCVRRARCGTRSSTSFRTCASIYGARKASIRVPPERGSRVGERPQPLRAIGRRWPVRGRGSPRWGGGGTAFSICRSRRALERAAADSQSPPRAAPKRG